MKVTIGKEGLNKSWQRDFPEETKCCRCGGVSRIGFVAHENMDEDDKYYPDKPYVSNLHDNMGKGFYWLHDACAVAVYFCRDCLDTTALYNQG